MRAQHKMASACASDLARAPAPRALRPARAARRLQAIRPGEACSQNRARPQCRAMRVGGVPPAPPPPPLSAAALASLQRPLWYHGARCLATVTLTMLASAGLVLLLNRMASKGLKAYEQSQDEEDAQSPTQQLLQSTFYACYRPFCLLLYLGGLLFSLKALAQYCTTLLHFHEAAAAYPPSWAVPAIKQAVRLLETAVYALLELDEVMGIAILVWVLLRWKEHSVRVFLRSRIAAAPGGGPSRQESAFEQIMLPLSSAASWLIFSCGLLASLQVLGINLTPMLTVGGISGIVIGLSAQAVVANVIGGMTLFISRPFLVGDRVRLSKQDGGHCVTGIVEAISPLQTHLRTDDSVPVTLPNKALGEMMIHNESRIGSSKEVLFYNKMRIISFKAVLRFEDFNRVEAIVGAYKDMLAAHPRVDTSLPLSVVLSDIDSQGLRISVAFHTMPEASRHYSSFKQEMLLAFGHTMTRFGADFPTLSYPSHSWPPLAPPSPPPLISPAPVAANGA